MCLAYAGLAFAPLAGCEQNANAAPDKATVATTAPGMIDEGQPRGASEARSAHDENVARTRGDGVVQIDDGHVAGPRQGYPIHLTFVGDISLTDLVASTLERRARGLELARAPGVLGRVNVPADYPFTQVKSLLSRADLTIGNLECAITTWPYGVRSHSLLRAPFSTPSVLLDAGFDLVSVANNHTMDFGRVGFEDTLSALREGGLREIGGEGMRTGTDRAYVHEVRGVKIGFVASFDQPDARVLAAIREARPGVDVLVVYLHWGTENQKEVIPYQRRLAHASIDQGAALVIGSHAHVVQATETYRGKFIAYGLGNFLFSGMGAHRSTRVGALLDVMLDADGAIHPQMTRVVLDALGAPTLDIDPARLP